MCLSIFPNKSLLNLNTGFGIYIYNVINQITFAEVFFISEVIFNGMGIFVLLFYIFHGVLFKSIDVNILTRNSIMKNM
jgi:hypothetical protein